MHWQNMAKIIVSFIALFRNPVIFFFFLPCRSLIRCRSLCRAFQRVNRVVKLSSKSGLFGSLALYRNVFCFVCLLLSCSSDYSLESFMRFARHNIRIRPSRLKTTNSMWCVCVCPSFKLGWRSFARSGDKFSVSRRYFQSAAIFNFSFSPIQTYFEC